MKYSGSTEGRETHSNWGGTQMIDSYYPSSEKIMYKYKMWAYYFSVVTIYDKFVDTSLVVAELTTGPLTIPDTSWAEILFYDEYFSKYFIILMLANFIRLEGRQWVVWWIKSKGRIAFLSKNEQGLASLFCKGPDNNYFWLYRL